MAPQTKEHIIPAFSATEDFGLVPEEEHDHNEIEHREININFKTIYNDLRNLDYSKVIWRNVIAFILLHSYCIYAVYLMFTVCMWKTMLCALFFHIFSAFGITMGVHRLWAHRSYKANLPLRIFLAFTNTMAFQNSIFDWSRDHRAHHKFSETDADPHNANRGFFFSHMGWLMYRKHPDVISKGKSLDVSDLLADPVVRFQKKFYLPLVVLCCFVLPTSIPVYYWGESITTSLMVCGFFRYTATLHSTWFVNSLAHWVGSKPFDKMIRPSQNAIVATLAMGEGWHNYHHVFPFDYRTAEFGGFSDINVTARVIDFFSYIGWAYDLKVATPEMCVNRAKRTGDGSRFSKESPETILLKKKVK